MGNGNGTPFGGRRLFNQIGYSSLADFIGFGYGFSSIFMVEKWKTAATQ